MMGGFASTSFAVASFSIAAFFFNVGPPVEYSASNLKVFVEAPRKESLLSVSEIAANIGGQNFAAYVSVEEYTAFVPPPFNSIRVDAQVFSSVTTTVTKHAYVPAGDYSIKVAAIGVSALVPSLTASANVPVIGSSATVPAQSNFTTVPWLGNAATVETT